MHIHTSYNTWMHLSMPMNRGKWGCWIHPEPYKWLKHTAWLCSSSLYGFLASGGLLQLLYPLKLLQLSWFSVYSTLLLLSAHRTQGSDICTVGFSSACGTDQGYPTPNPPITHWGMQLQSPEHVQTISLTNAHRMVCISWVYAHAIMRSSGCIHCWISFKGLLLAMYPYLNLYREQYTLLRSCELCAFNGTLCEPIWRC